MQAFATGFVFFIAICVGVLIKLLGKGYFFIALFGGIGGFLASLLVTSLMGEFSLSWGKVWLWLVIALLIRLFIKKF